MSETRKIEDEILAERTKAHNKSVGFYGQELNDLEANRAKLKQLNDMLVQLNNAKARGDKKVYIDVYKRQTYAIGFTMVPAAYSNNEISYQHDFMRKMEKTTRALADALDKGAVAALEANKTQVFKTLLNYTQTGNVVQVPTQMATEILGDINPIMRANCYPEYIHLIANAGVDSLIRKLAQHGVYNDVNKRMEYDNKVLHLSLIHI